MKKSILAVTSIIICISILFTGCKWALFHRNPPTVLNSIPDFMNKTATDGSDNRSFPIELNLFYDNTKSMQGYINGDSGKEFSNTFIKTTDVLCSIMESADFDGSVVYRLEENNGNHILEWEDFETSDFSECYTKKNFYSFSENSHFESSTNGPLQSLFSGGNDSPVDFDKLNVFITDMNEQNLNNTDLAKKIYDATKNQKDYSILLYCINSEFHGMVYVPTDKVKDEHRPMKEYDYKGYKPFYLLAVGKTYDIVEFSKRLSKGFEDKQLTEGKDYFRADILSNYGLKTVELENIITESKKFNRNELYVPNTFIEGDNTQLNMNVENILWKELFKNQQCNALCFRHYETLQSKTEKNKAKINIYIPFPELVDGTSPDDVTLTLDNSFVNGERSFICEVKSFMEDNNRWDTSEETEWSDLFTIKTNKVNKDEKVLFVNNYESVKEAYDFAFDTEEEKYINLNLQNGGLIVTIDFKNVDTIKGELIALNLKVYASRKQYSENTPEWMDNFDYDRSYKSENEISEEERECTKTKKLINFYEVLKGDILEGNDFNSENGVLISEIPIIVDFR